MNANMRYANAADGSAGAMREMCTNAAVVLLCAVLATLALTAALLLLTLPGTLDAVASQAAVDVPQIDERHPGQVIADWVDALNASELAGWRLRSSD